MRKSLALILSAGLLVSLAACSGAPAAPDCATAAPSGGSSDLVTATGELGADPAATFPSPLVPSGIERSVIEQGDGPTVGLGSTVNVTYAVYDGATGEAASTPQSGFLVVSDGLPAGLADALLCTNGGDRVAVVLPNEDATQLKADATGSLVMVFDLLDVYPQAADGDTQPAQSGFPGVVHDENGRPGVTISGEAPTEAKSTLIKKGDGPEVADGDRVLVQSTAVSWETKKVTSSTWADGSPGLWLMSEDATQTSGSTQPAGITPYLVGQPVGSEVLVLLPASGDGGVATAYVVDILGVLPAS